MLLQVVDDGLLVAFPERQVAFADSCSNTDTELVARGVGGHAADVVADDGHCIAAVCHAAVVAAVGLRCRAVNDGNEVVSDDDAVLAFHCQFFGDEGLFEDCHEGAFGNYGLDGVYGHFWGCPYTRRNIGAGLLSRVGSWH